MKNLETKSFQRTVNFVHSANSHTEIFPNGVNIIELDRYDSRDFPHLAGGAKPALRRGDFVAGFMVRTTPKGSSLRPYWHVVNMDIYESPERKMRVGVYQDKDPNI